VSINQYVSVYMYVRDADGNLVKRNKTGYKKFKYGKYILFNRPPMMYIEAQFESGGVIIVPCERTGPDEYTEHLKESNEEKT